MRPFLNHCLKLRELVRARRAASSSRMLRDSAASSSLLAAGGDGVERRLGGQHAGLDRGVAALDAAGVQVAGFAADEGAARKHRLRQLSRPPAVIARAP